MHLRKIGAIALLASLAWLASCAPSRYVRPLEKGELAVSGSLGGALFTNFGAPIPIPNTSIGAGYGISERWTGYANFYPTAAAFGDLQFDLGGVCKVLEPAGWRPGVSVSPGLNLVGDVWDGGFKVWPSLDANAYWNYGTRHNYAYAGFSSWWELARTRAHGEPQPQFILPGCQIGHVFSGERWDFSTELKLQNFTKSNQDLTVDWVSPGKTGALAIYFGVSKRFGK